MKGGPDTYKNNHFLLGLLPRHDDYHAYIMVWGSLCCIKVFHYKRHWCTFGKHGKAPYSGKQSSQLARQISEAFWNDSGVYNKERVIIYVSGGWMSNDLYTHVSSIFIHLLYQLYITQGGKKGQNYSMEFLKNNHLDIISSMNKGPWCNSFHQQLPYIFSIWITWRPWTDYCISLHQNEEKWSAFLCFTKYQDFDFWSENWPPYYTFRSQCLVTRNCLALENIWTTASLSLTILHPSLSRPM